VPQPSFAPVIGRGRQGWCYNEIGCPEDDGVKEDDMAGSKSLLTEIMATRLPPGERTRFKKWSDSVSNEEFDAGLSSFFENSAIQDAVGEYAIEQLQELEMHLHIRIAATIEVHDRVYSYRESRVSEGG
jgi:hypothetical protein